MKTMIQSDNEGISAIQNFLAMVATIRDKITQLPRGPWRVKVRAGYDRSLFLNSKFTELNYEVDFVAVRELWDNFFDKEIKAAEELEKSFRPLAQQLAQSKSLEGARETIEQALQGLHSYDLNLNTQLLIIPKFKAALAQSLRSARTEFYAYLKTQVVGKSEATKQFLGFESQIKDTISQLENILMVEIPEKYKSGEEMLQAALSFAEA